MAGYTPVFDSVFQGSLCGKYPDLPVWLVLLALTGKSGIIDAHPSYIATISGLPQADIEAAIARFCEPDPDSRTADHEGRRLERLPNRGFGWRVLNHDRYRAKARKRDYDDERTESGRDAARKQAARDTVELPSPDAIRDVPTRPDSSRRVPPSESEAEAEEREQERAGARHVREKRSVGKGTRLPDDWQPSTDGIELPPDLDIAVEADRFRDYWRSKAGAAGTKLDWQATWRNWIRTCRDTGKYAKKAQHRWQ